MHLHKIFQPALFHHEQMLEGWSYETDPSTAKSYYVNDITQISQWDPPAMKG